MVSGAGCGLAPMVATSPSRPFIRDSPPQGRSGKPPPFRRAKSSTAPERQVATHPGVELA